MALTLQQVDVSTIIKAWGPWGVILVCAGILIWKWVLPRIDKHLEARALERARELEDSRNSLTTTIADARQERDYMRQKREQEVERFVSTVENISKSFTDTLKERDRELANVLRGFSDKR